MVLVCCSGILLSDPNGEERWVYPRLYSYVCDHQEGCKVYQVLTQVINDSDIYFLVFSFEVLEIIIFCY